MVEDWQNGGFGIYIHWPFCQSKCPYCDFNSHVRQTIDHNIWKDALLSELRHAAALVPNRSVQSVYFGGGTPSLMAPKTVQAIIDEIVKIWPVGNDLEITLEANPTSIEATKFNDFSSAGISRVSIGLQALNDPDLKKLGRLHTTKESIKALDIAKKYYEKISFDLIYARQDQTLADWQNELTHALDLSTDHLSLYQLTIENGTRFGDLYSRGNLTGLPSDSLAADMYILTEEMCKNNGLDTYEVSNYARPGAASRHNLIYWRYGDYIGIGPGAHGRITVNGQKRATLARAAPEAWITDVQANGFSFHTVELISQVEQAEEYLMMSLRLAEGTDIQRYMRLSGQPLDADKIGFFIRQNLLEHDNGRLRATTSGRLVLNSILKDLLIN